MKTENRIAKYLDDQRREIDREELAHWRSCMMTYAEERVLIANRRVREAEQFEARAILYCIVATAILVIAAVWGGW